MSSHIAPSVAIIENPFSDIGLLDFSEAPTEDKNAIIKSLYPNKAAEPDLIPLKIIKATANIIYTHFAGITNKDLKANK